MVDMNKLMGKMREKGVTVEALAEAVGVSRATLYRRMRKNALLIREANKIVAILELTPDEALAIFFSDFVA